MGTPERYLQDTDSPPSAGLGLMLKQTCALSMKSKALPYK